LSDRRNPDPARALETLLDALVSEEPLESTLQIGLQALVASTSADVAAVLVRDEERFLCERWYPEERGQSPMADTFRRAVREPLLLQDPSAAAARVGAPSGTVIIPLVAHGLAVGAVCFIPAIGAAPRGDQVRRLVRALSCRAAIEIEMTHNRRMQERYERWFKTLDDQLRLLDRERQKFSAMVHASDAAVFVTDTTRTIRWTNSVMAGRPPEGGAAWIGLSCGDVCHSFAGGSGSGLCEDCPVARALGENVAVHREFHDTTRDAGRSFYLTALPIKGPDGRPDEAMVMIQDLSDLEILRTSESRYRLLFERSGRGIVMIDPATRKILLANASASWMVGCDRDALLARSLEDLHTPAEWTRLESVYAEAIEKGDLTTRECRMLHYDGWERPVTVSGTRTDLDGRPVQMLEFRDNTEARRVEEALRVAEERLRAVVAGSPIVLFALDRDGVFTVSEGRGLASLGLERGQVVGQSVFELYKDVPEILENIRLALEGEELTGVVELGPLAFETTYTPLRGPDGTVEGVIGVATDVTERRRLEEQLRQAQRMEAIGRLAGGVAHDFNNLLAAILGHSELMMNRLEAAHPLRRNAEEVQKAAVRGAMLTRQLLSFGRKDMLSFQVLDLNSVVAGMDGMLQRLIGEDIELRTLQSPRPATVRGDRGQLEQVILNLVVNARDAMPQGGGLTIEVGHALLDEVYAQRHARVQPGRYARLSITDTGVGMDAETLKHIFEPFYTTKERGKGTGLGLATVYGIVEQSGGHVNVYSEPGMGSTFHVYLPGAGEIGIEVQETARAEPARGGTETILVVEDEGAVRALAVDVLQSLGYRVLTAGNGVEALEVAAGHPGEIHLLVTDVVMPQMGGGELSQRLVSERPGLRVLYVSGYPDDTMVRHGVLERGSVLLQKPFVLADFVAKVREVLDAPASPAQQAA